jgi:ABC-type multidrug transport system fused ATPase/permease subunit
MTTLNKILKILTYSEKKNFYYLIILVLIMVFLDVVGISFIFPFVSILLDPDQINKNETINYVYNLSKDLGINSKNQFIFFLGFCNFFFLILSISFRGFVNYLLIKFVLFKEYSLGKRLVEDYLGQSYNWFLNQNSSDLAKNILSEIEKVVILCLLPFVQLIAHLTFSIVIFFIILFINPKLSSFIIFILAGSYLIIFLLMKNFIKKIGINRLEANNERYKVLSAALSSYKEVKIMNLENKFTNFFSKPAKTYAMTQAWLKTIAQIPRYLLEVITFGGILLLILVLLYQGENMLHILPLLTFYIFAAYRLMPSLQHIYSSIVQIRFSRPALDMLYLSLNKLKINEQKNTQPTSINFKRDIILEDVSFKYSSSSNLTLKNINLKIKAFSRVGIVGHSGSGKSTLVDIITGLQDPTQGYLKVDEIKILNDNKKSWQKKIGYVPQNIYLTDASIAENIAYGQKKSEIDYEKITQISKIIDLNNFVINKLPIGYDTIIGERGARLSGGQIQRIGIARALYLEPEILIFDESTSALDYHSEDLIMNNIVMLMNKTIITITHRLPTLMNADIIFLMDEGEIVFEGKYNELLKNNKSFQKITSFK